MQTVVGSEQLRSFCKRFQARAGQMPLEELVDTFLPRDFRRVAAAFLYFDQVGTRSRDRARLGRSASSGSAPAYASPSPVRRRRDFRFFSPDFRRSVPRRLAPRRSRLGVLNQNVAHDPTPRLFDLCARHL